MEVVEAIFYKKVNPGDLLNIDYALHPGGGGQTYFDLAGVPEGDLCRFLEYGTIIERDNPPVDDNRIKYGIQAIAIGTNESKLIEFDPRNDRPNYKISDQRNNRHPAWTERFGFPHAPEGARYAKDVTNIPHLLVFIVRTNERRYYAGFLNRATLPNTWPVGVGFEQMLQGIQKGIIFFGQATIIFNNNAATPFFILTTAPLVNPAELPDDIANQATDAIEFLDADIEMDGRDVEFRFIEHANPAEEMAALRTNPLHAQRIGRHINQMRAQRNRIQIGFAGEKAAVDYEKKRLIAAHRPDLAEAIEWVSQTQGDGTGFDIHSYDVVNGETVDRFIEVKTTTGGITKPFDVSLNEVTFSEEASEKFVLFRIFQYELNNSTIHFYSVSGPLHEHFRLDPMSFLATKM